MKHDSDLNTRQCKTLSSIKNTIKYELKVHFQNSKTKEDMMDDLLSDLKKLLLKTMLMNVHICVNRALQHMYDMLHIQHISECVNTILYLDIQGTFVKMFRYTYI